MSGRGCWLLEIGGLFGDVEASIGRDSGAIDVCRYDAGGSYWQGYISRRRPGNEREVNITWTTASYARRSRKGERR